MSTSTFTVTQADGSSETYPISREQFTGIRNMEVDGVTISLDRTPDVENRIMTVDGVQISVNNYFPEDDDTATILNGLTFNGLNLTFNNQPLTYNG